MAKRRFEHFAFDDLHTIKQQVLHWSARFNTCCYLDNNQHDAIPSGYECLAAAGEIANCTAKAGNAFAELKRFSEHQDDWLFGHFSYDLKQETEQSPSLLPDFIQFPDLFFFVPKILIIVRETGIEIGSLESDHHEIFGEIILTALPALNNNPAISSAIHQRIPKDEYLEIIRSLQQHILRGDCYEINFCQEFFAGGAVLQPAPLFQLLSSVSPSPFSAFYRLDEKYLICASPERYLKKNGELISSQPIKGTAARDLQNPYRDEYLKLQLADSAKERAENVMVVDLVRNDLSKISEPDSVRVAELFGIYSFAQVHQMISTITGKPQEGLHWTEMIFRTFPMGSMTGAPKKRVLQLIEQYEKSRRGLFSGALGYVTPGHDFDFNVVIRSLLYNQGTQYLAYFAGSAITAESIPELEYEECLVKVAAIENILKNPFPG